MTSDVRCWYERLGDVQKGQQFDGRLLSLLEVQRCWVIQCKVKSGRRQHNYIIICVVASESQ